MSSSAERARRAPSFSALGSTALAGVLALAGAIAGGPVSAQEVHQLRIANFVAPTHPINRFFETWSQELTEASGGRLQFTIYHSAQLGPAPRYFDIARRGQADITWVLHGSLPSRFPVSELSNLPFLFCSGAHASVVLNDPELREGWLDAEHDGVKVLNIHATAPGHLWTARNRVAEVADMQALAIRPASRTIGAYVSALGATPVGLEPNELADAMEKGTAQGGFMDYPAGAFSFQIGTVTDHITELNAYVTSFSIVMNENAFDDLPEDLQALITGSLEGREAEIGGGWDRLTEPAKAQLAGDGVEFITPEDEAFAEFRRIGEEVAQAWVAQLDADGKPASAAYARMKELAEQHRTANPDLCL